MLSTTAGEGFMTISARPPPDTPNWRSLALDTLLADGPDAIVVMDERGVVRAFSRQAETLFGHRSDDLLGRDVGVLMPAYWARRHQGFVERYLRTGEARLLGRPRTVRARRRDGTEFDAEIALSRIDHLGLFLAVLRDLTERRRLEADALEAATTEQARLARDLHDGVAQDLVALRHLLAGLEARLAAGDAGTEARRLCTRTREVAEHAAGALRDAVHGLAPGPVTCRELPERLAGLGEAVTRIAPGMRFRFEAPTGVLPAVPVLAEHVHRMALEAVRNAARHSGGTEVRVTLTQEEDVLVLCVEDDGRGPAGIEVAPEGSFGLRSLRYRCASTGGRFAVEDRGPGTRVRCAVPLTPTGSRPQRETHAS